MSRRKYGEVFATGKAHFTLTFFVVKNEWPNFLRMFKTSTPDKAYKKRPKACSSTRGPLPSSVYLGIALYPGEEPGYEAT